MTHSMSDLEHLYELQTLDTATDHLTYRRSHLDERTRLGEVRKQLAAQRTAQAAATERQRELEARYTESEVANRDRDGRRTRLEAKLRTIVITREAEAVQRELAMLHDEQDAADEAGLMMLDEMEGVGVDLDRIAGEIAVVEAAEHDAAAALVVVEADVDVELADVATRRTVAVELVPAPLVARYVEMRPKFRGVAVAKLHGPQCTGCHMDLSRVELEAVWHTPEGTLPECPQCARLLLK